MLLKDTLGRGVEVRVTGYQFPQADDARQRYSWHMVEGCGRTDEGEWDFRYPALTCDETPSVSNWLREVAAARTSTPLRFTEPNLTFGVDRHDGNEVVLSLGLDIEFLPPWRKPPPANPIPAGDPYVIYIRLTVERLIDAAAQWDTETAAYPDRLASPGGTVR